MEPDASQRECFLELRTALEREPDGPRRVLESRLEERFGKAVARSLYLELARSQIPAALERRAAAGIDPAITARTLADLELWVEHFRRQTGHEGITSEIFDWSQRYLRGNLVRIGSVQFDLMSFPGRARVFRHRKTGALAGVTVDGELELELRTGVPTGARGSFSPESWELVLDPSKTVVTMHIPADADLEFRAIIQSVKKAIEHFAVRLPSSRPVAACGETWFFDPQLAGFFKNTGVRRMLEVCSFYPSSLPEAGTLRRLFGPDVTRADLASIPRASLSSLHLGLVELLSRPGSRLTATGGFLLREDLESLEEYSGAGEATR